MNKRSVGRCFNLAPHSSEVMSSPPEREINGTLMIDVQLTENDLQTSQSGAGERPHCASCVECASPLLEAALESFDLEPAFHLSESHPLSPSKPRCLGHCWHDDDQREQGHRCLIACWNAPDYYNR